MVSGVRHTAVSGGQESHARVGGQHRSRSVDRTVVDDHDFKIDLFLEERTADCFSEKSGAVVYGHDHGDIGDPGTSGSVDGDRGGRWGGGESAGSRRRMESA